MKKQTTRIEQAIEEIKAMDSKTVDSLVKTLEGDCKLLSGGPFETPEEINAFWVECIGDVEPFPAIIQALDGACSVLNRKRLIAEILIKACVGVNDYGQPMLKRDRVSIPHAGTYIASLDESGRFTATCESVFNLN